jgi:hypothetical protein
MPTRGKDSTASAKDQIMTTLPEHQHQVTVVHSLLPDHYTQATENIMDVTVYNTSYIDIRTYQKPI